MLWDEYTERCPEGYRYSRFCELYRSWASRLSVTMRQSHIGGDKLFVDYAGDTVPVIVDRLLDRHCDREIADIVNQRGCRTWKEKPFNLKKIAFIRTAYKLPSRY